MITKVRIGIDARKEKEMAKYRHRIFEMYDFRDEAIRALTPKTARPVTEATDPESWSFKRLAVSLSGCVTHVEFKSSQISEEETVSDLREDFGQLVNKLAGDSKVLLNFAGVKSFYAASIGTLVLFDQKLRHKGSRIVLCCLEPAARESFFPASST